MPDYFDLPERVKAAVRLEEVIGETIRLSRSGHDLVGAHHTHDSKSGTSLHVSPDKQVWHCFNCKSGGDVITWVMHAERMSFHDALRQLARRARIPMPEWTPEERQRYEELRSDETVVARIFLAAAEYYHTQLTPVWQGWCADKWGLTAETLAQYRIGYAPVSPQGLWKYLRGQGMASQDLVKSGLFLRINGQFLDFFQGRIVFPYWQTLPDASPAPDRINPGHAGVIVYWIGRQTEQTPKEEWEQAKYRKLPVHSEKHPYISACISNRYFFGEHCLPQLGDRPLLVTEGIADALAALQAGIPCISPVTTSFRERDWPRLVGLGNRARRVVIINDAERNGAGMAGALRTARHLFTQGGIDARIGELLKSDDIDKMDIAEFLKAQSPTILQGLIDNAETLIRYYLTRVQAAPDADKPAVAKEMYPLVWPLTGVTRAAAEKHLAKALGVNVKALQESMQEAAVEAKAKASEEGETTTPVVSKIPYEVQDGRIVMYGDGPLARLLPAQVISDFTATITEEVTTEAGDKIFVMGGHTVAGAPFTVSISAREFADERALKSALTEAAGADATIYAGMQKHLGPAIQLLTRGTIQRTRQYARTGWTDGRFLLPGREPEGVRIHLPRKLPYRVDPHADLSQGLTALTALIRSMATQQSTVALMPFFAAPMALLMQWRNDRSGLFIKGRTGSFKTSWAQVAMSLYGAEFMSDHLIIKLGQGATMNSIMTLATQAHDLPLLIDNYKPSTGGGLRDLVNLVHNILEGGERDRLTRNAELRETKAIFCWPIFTGEDTPDRDAATAARLLIVPFAWTPGEPNPELTKAQTAAHHLSAVGQAWVAWLESDDGHQAATAEAPHLDEQRSAWAKILGAVRQDMVNVMRVATNLTTNQLTWDVLLKHPAIGPVLKEFTDAHTKGLLTLAREMAGYTAESLDATRFLIGLRELLATEQALLLDPHAKPVNDAERARTVGWKLENGDIYLLPNIARTAVDRLLGPRGLGDLSSQTLHDQLDKLGYLCERKPGDLTTVKWIASEHKSIRVLYLKAEAISHAQP